jgi:hypothetical protein
VLWIATLRLVSILLFAVTRLLPVDAAGAPSEESKSGLWSPRRWIVEILNPRTLKWVGLAAAVPSDCPTSSSDAMASRKMTHGTWASVTLPRSRARPAPQRMGRSAETRLKRCSK